MLVGWVSGKAVAVGTSLADRQCLEAIELSRVPHIDYLGEESLGSLP